MKTRVDTNSAIICAIKMKFILTKELGRLARWLRLLGYDAEYFNSDNMKELFVRSFNETRVIVTKRKDGADIKSVKVIYVKNDLLKGQLSELEKKLKVKIRNKGLFTRCSDCNKEVFRIQKRDVKGVVPDYVFKTQENFFQCPSCEKIFWKATHWTRAREFYTQIRRICNESSRIRVDS